MAWSTLQQAEPVGQGLLLGGGGEFVQEAFGEEGVVGVADAAPGAHGHRHFAAQLPHADVGQGVGQFEGALDVVLVGRVHGELGEDAFHGVEPQGGSRHLVQPCERFAIGPEAGLEVGHGHGAVEVVLGVFVAAPGELDGAALGGEGNGHGLFDHVELQPPAKAAAQVRHVQGDRVQGYAGHACRGLLGE